MDLLKSVFLTGLAFLLTLTTVHSLSCISMNNQECKVIPQIVNVNVIISCSFLLVLKQVNAVVVTTRSIIHIQNCVSDVVKNLIVKVFNLISKTNEIRHIGMKRVSVNVD